MCWGKCYVTWRKLKKKVWPERHPNIHMHLFTPGKWEEMVSSSKTHEHSVSSNLSAVVSLYIYALLSSSHAEQLTLSLMIMIMMMTMMAWAGLSTLAPSKIKGISCQEFPNVSRAALNSAPQLTLGEDLNLLFTVGFPSPTPKSLYYCLMFVFAFHLCSVSFVLWLLSIVHTGVQNLSPIFECVLMKCFKEFILFIYGLIISF